MAIDLNHFAIFALADGPLNGGRSNRYCDQVSIDSRAITSPNALFVALPGTRSDGHHFLHHAEMQGARFALVSKNYKSSRDFKRLLLIRVNDPLFALQQLAHHHRMNHRAKVIAISGSSGKTVLKDLLKHLLKTKFRLCCSAESYNSQIGVALSLLQIKPSDELAIIECGISLPQEMEILAKLACPDCAILTNIEDKHSDTLGPIDRICLEKSRLLFAVPSCGWALIPRHAVDILVQNDLAIPPHWKIWDEGSELFFSSPSAQNLRISNGIAHCSSVVAQLLKMCPKLIKKRLLSYRPQIMCLEMWRVFAGFTLINDLYCADLASLTKTLEWANLFCQKGCKKILWFSGIQERDRAKTRLALQRQSQGFEIDEIILGNPLSGRENDSHLIPSFSSLKRGDILIFRGIKKLNPHQLARQIGFPLPPATLKIDLAAIAHNIRLIRKALAPSTTVMAMLKARAYGTDDEIMARFLTRCGIDHFGLATVEEAISLRRAGITGQLLVLHAAKMQWDVAVKYDLQICVSQKQEIFGLAKCAMSSKKVAKLHLHVDTGMCRLGCAPKQALALAELIEKNPYLKLQGVMGHLASADLPNQGDFTKEQCSAFQHILATLKTAQIEPRYSHLANSAGALSIDQRSCNLIRIGLALFGLTSPDLHRHLILKPALTLDAKIAHLHTIKRGQSVSYGRKYTALREKERIAVVPLGYADGLQRHFARANVMIKGEKAPIVGAICMDFTMCDVTHISGVRIGDTATIFDQNGVSHSARHLAQELGISAHEIIASLGPRIQRLFCFDQKPISPAQIRNDL